MKRKNFAVHVIKLYIRCHFQLEIPEKLRAARFEDGCFNEGFSPVCGICELFWLEFFFKIIKTDSMND